MKPSLLEFVKKYFHLVDMPNEIKDDHSGIPKYQLVAIHDDTPVPQRTEIDDLGAKCAAHILLANQNGGIIVPSQEEWIGLNLLERDDELPNRKKHKNGH